VTTDRDKLLSEFIDAWNAGKRPDVGAFLERAGPDERGPLSDDMASFLTWAPTPDYDDATLEAMAADPIVVEALAAARGRAGLWPALLSRARARASLSTRELASRLVGALGLPAGSETKTERYLGQMEEGRLDPGGVSRRVLTAIATALGLSVDDLENAGALGGWQLQHVRFSSAPPVFRAEEDAAEAVREDLEVLADALTTPAAEPWDEVDELFRGGR
jgi:transcriptional regulator with XRE-family HTH domain